MAKRIRLEVCPQSGAWPWKVTVCGQAEYRHQTQAEAIESARRWIAGVLKRGFTATLKIKRRDGTIRDERTYPRSSDPRRSKG